MLIIFSCVYESSVCRLWRNDVCLGLCPLFYFILFFFMLNCMSYLYVLDINHLTVGSFVNIFSHTEVCLFVLFMVSFILYIYNGILLSHRKEQIESLVKMWMDLVLYRVKSEREKQILYINTYMCNLDLDDLIFKAQAKTQTLLTQTGPDVYTIDTMYKTDNQ